MKTLLTDPSDLNSPKSDKESDYEQTQDDTKKIKTKEGQLSIKNHGIPKREWKIVKIKCPICGDIVYSQKRMNRHMKEQHPRFKFCCSYCQVEYDTYNGCYRHTQRHFKLRYECDQCDKQCQYPHELSAHKRTHTHKGLYPCAYRGCSKKFVSKKNDVDPHPNPFRRSFFMHRL